MDAADKTVDEVDGTVDGIDEDVEITDEDVERSDDVDGVVDIDEDVLDVVSVAGTPNSYISSRNGPPQNSEEFPAQSISHPVNPSVAGPPSFSKSFPHPRNISYSSLIGHMSTYSIRLRIQCPSIRIRYPGKLHCKYLLSYGFHREGLIDTRVPVQSFLPHNIR